MSHEVDSEPSPKARARALAILFGSVAVMVSVTIWLTGERSDFIDYLFIFGFPPTCATLAYLIGLYVSDKAIS